MKTLRTKLDSMWGAVLVICLTIVISSAATATAAKLINGKNIKKGTIVGPKLKKDTLTGTQINESSLGRVPLAASANSATSADSAASAASASNATNAEKLGGLSSSAFVQGSGHVYSRSVSAPLSTNNNTVLEIPGYGVLMTDCAFDGFATPKFLNTSGAAMTLVGGTVHFGGSTPSSTPSAANNSTTTLVGRDFGNTTMHAWNPVAGGKVLELNFSNSFCNFAATGITSG